MRLVTFVSRGAVGSDHTRLGMLIDGDRAVVDVTGTMHDGRELATMLGLIEAGRPALDAVAEAAARPGLHRVAAIDSVRLLAPLPWPRRIRGSRRAHVALARCFPPDGAPDGRS